MIRKFVASLALVALAVAALAQQSNLVKDVVVSGNQHVSLAAILAAMRTKKGSPYVQAQLDQDKAALEDLGFFDAVDVRAHADDPSGWIVNVDLHEYPVIKEVQITGNHAIKTADILKALNLPVGQIFNARTARASAQIVEQLYVKRGFFCAVTDFGPLRDSPNTLGISILEITVGKVSVQGNRITKQRVFNHLIKTRPGEPYSIKKWGQDLNRINSTRWFDSINSQEDDRREAGKVDLTAIVKEAKSSTFGIGAQIDPRSSIAGFVNLSAANYQGTGQTFGVGVQQTTGGGGTSVNFDYSNPFIDNRDTSFNFSAYSKVIYRFQNSAFGGSNSFTNDNRYRERRTGTTFGVGRPIGPQVTASVGARLERIKTDDLTLALSDSFIQQDGDVDVLDFGVARNRRDNDLDPSRGDFTRLSFSPGISNIVEVGGALADVNNLGHHTFYKYNADFRKYFSPGQKPRRTLDEPRRVIALRARYGFITGDPPFFEQYFVGGSDTIRGYAEDRYWGKNQAIFTGEYRFPVQKSFNLIGFVDYGSAWGGYGTVNSYTQTTSAKFHTGYGIGAAFKTFLGPIRLDLGFDNRGKSRLHFQIGTSF